MINEYELFNSLRRDVLPRLLDGAVQGVFVCVLIYFAQAFLPNETSSNWQNSVWWLCFMLIWGTQHYIFQMMLRRRARRAESRYEEMPDGLYTAMTRMMTPSWMDALLQAAGLIFLMHWYFETRTLHVPQYMVDFVWALVLLPLWLLQNQCLKTFLEQRGRNAFYGFMYELLAKQTQS